uniref:Kinesin-like protein Kif23 Arf6-interacting domain-containing protein n=1 Tax=Plectus sambesii TaxID=2011161 RepID=A0A914UWX3_9BILA
MKPKLRNAKATTRPEASDLRKSTEYVLTHQEVDQDGVLRTELVKGDVIPTAGGGSAVLFNDIERLTHESPGGKRRSNDENVPTYNKRNKN